MRRFGSHQPLAPSRLWTWCALWLSVSTAAWGQGPSQSDGSRWPDQRQLGPFFFHADFDLTGKQALLRQVETLQHDLQQQIPVAVVGQPVHVFLFARTATYASYVQRHFPSAPRRKALFIKQGGPGMVFAPYSTDVAVDLRHEGVHAILHSALPMVPLWLDEGLAEYFEVDPAMRAMRRDYWDLVRRQASWRRLPSLTALEALDDAVEMTSADYRWSWAWTHFLLHGPAEANAELESFLGDIARHVPPDRLSVRLRRRLPDLDQQFKKHWQTWGTTTRSVQAPPVEMRK